MNNLWRLQLRQEENLFPDSTGHLDGKVRIPVSGSILWSREVRALVDTAAFQRLRDVKQLGPTHHVYPGATHTRFEHSLGVYWLALRYLERLLYIPTFRERCTPLDESLKTVVAAALLHDIGHYPFSHWIEEIDVFPGQIHLPHHEARASTIIQADEVSTILQRDWGIKPAEVIKIIKGEGSKTLRGVVSGVLDADKMDYLVRDSIHCGVDYGLGIDVDRLIESLYVNPDTPSLTITHKGQSALMSLVATRNIMYKEVYWHKTVRACQAMFKRLFYEYVGYVVSTNQDLESCKSIVEGLLKGTEAEFVVHLNQVIRERQDLGLAGLMKPFAQEDRAIYKPAYVHTLSVNKADGPFSDFLFKISDMGYAQLVSISTKLNNLLSSEIDIRSPYDVILEATPVKGTKEIYELGSLRMFDVKRGQDYQLSDTLRKMNDYLNDSRQVYIFCRPDLYDPLQRLIRHDTKWQSIISQM